MTHQQLGTPVVWCRVNLTVHLVRELADCAQEHKDWLRISQMPLLRTRVDPDSRHLVPA